MRRSFLLTVLLLGTALSRPVRGALPDASLPAPDAVSLARLDALNQHAGAIYAAARLANWKEANRLLRQLAASVMALENPADPAQRPLLHAMGKLVWAVRSKDGTATMYAANRVLRWSVEREAGDRPAEAGLARLEFLTRELGGRLPGRRADAARGSRRETSPPLGDASVPTLRPGLARPRSEPMATLSNDSAPHPPRPPLARPPSPWKKRVNGCALGYRAPRRKSSRPAARSIPG